ncbi:MAG: SCO7613 C-terminal domain-containing membrane protein [Stenotrophomonas sp.]
MIIDRLTGGVAADNVRAVVGQSTPVSAAMRVSAPTVAVTAAAPSSTHERATARISVQSILAVAGAGLFAVAAIVFTFLNPDLTDFVTRSLVVAGVTAVFLGGAWFLATVGLRFSAETVGALGTVFIALDVWAIATGSIPGADPWLLGGIATLAVSAGLVTIAWLTRLRSWLWLGFIGLAVSPAMIGYSFGTPWWTAVGHLTLAAVALTLHSVARRLAERFGSPLLTEHTTATVLQISATGVVLAQAIGLPSTDATLRSLFAASLIAALAVLAALAARHQVRTFWSVTAGAFAVGAAIPLTFLTARSDDAWYLGSVPVVTAVILAMLSVIARAGTRNAAGVRLPAVLVGGWAVALLAAAPSILLAALQFLMPLTSLVARGEGIAIVVGIGAAALATATLAWGSRSSSSALSRRALVSALWLASAGIVAVASWSGFIPAAQAAIAIGSSLAVISVVKYLGAWPVARRAPLVVVVHVLLVLAIAVVFTDPTLSVLGGTAIAATIFFAGRVAVPGLRPLYTAAGYGFSLIVLAVGLHNTALDVSAVLGITSAVGSATALGITLVRRISAAHWYAVLAVTAVPFGIGIVSVLLERSGWAALSTAVMFTLALTLMLTRRPGLGRPLRSLAAGLLVPSLAVVVVCLGGWLLDTSGSPIALPVVAVIVAVTLPLTMRIGRALETHGLVSADARAARLWIEISSLVTASLAVLLALVRAAAGLTTSFQVLAIIGIGALAAGLMTRRRYAWYVAFASFTGALWCLLAMAEVVAVEPYTLPPAIAATIIGAIVAARRASGRVTYSVGLAFAIVPSLLPIVTPIPLTDAAAPPRTAALLAGALALLLLGAWLRRRRDARRAPGLAILALPTLTLAGLAAVAGAAQAVRLGWSLDVVPGFDDRLVILPALGLSAVAAALAAAAAVVASRDIRSRWLLAPALVLLAAGPIASVRVETMAVTVLWLLMGALLALMLITVYRARTREVLLPPVWFTFLVAWLVAVTGWSTREFLRVEAFSLALGLALLAAGVVAMTARRASTATLGSWPVGFGGSWWLLTPGIVVTLLPSVLATATDPQTWRAVLVIALALTAILIGSLRKLAAPFLVGLIALPIEIIVVFAVQIGQGIEASTWWITLATAGAVLLVIAVTSERRARADRGVAARLRDLT